MNAALLETGPSVPPQGEGMGGAPPAAQGGQSPVGQHGAAMLEAFMQNPDEAATAELTAIAVAIQQILSQGQGGPQAPPQGGMPQGAPAEGPPMAM